MSDITAETRREAYKAVQRETADVNRAVILMAISRHFPYGATCYEVAKYLGWHITSVRPRMTELSKPYFDKPAELMVTGKRVNAEFSSKACAVYALITPGELPLFYGGVDKEK